MLQILAIDEGEGQVSNNKYIELLTLPLGTEYYHILPLYASISMADLFLFKIGDGSESGGH